MFKSIQGSFITALVLITLIIILLGCGTWFYFYQGQRIGDSIESHRRFNSKLATLSSQVQQNVYFPNLQTKVQIDQALHDISDQLNNNKLLGLTALEREKSLHHLNQVESVLNQRVNEKQEFSAHDKSRVENQRQAFVKIEDELGGVSALLQEHLVLLENERARLNTLTVRIIIGVLIVLIITIIGLTLLTFRKFLNPLKRMQRLMKEFSEGNLSARAEPFDIVELARFADTFNQMAANLSQTIHHLELSNENLESFSYSVSHDLRGPLRAMDGFSRILEENYAERLDSKGLGYLQKIQKSTERMSELIEDILRLSKLGRELLNPQKNTDLEPIIHEIMHELKEKDPTLSIQLEINGPLRFDCDPALMKTALSNLLGNACKFSKNKPHPRVKISAITEKDARLLKVQDNGEGFDSRFTDHLFLPFKRLHAQTEFPGNGIGLSIVKRIIDKHRAEIWGESHPGEGAVFTIRFPHRQGVKIHESNPSHPAG